MPLLMRRSALSCNPIWGRSGCWTRDADNLHQILREFVSKTQKTRGPDLTLPKQRGVSIGLRDRRRSGPMRPFYVLFSIIVLLAVVGLAEASLSGSGLYECQNRANAVGRGSYIYTMAQMNAVTSWVEEQQAIDPTFSSWHHAQNKKLFCAARKGTHYQRCIALAQPCRPRLKEQRAFAGPSAPIGLSEPPR